MYRSLADLRASVDKLIEQQGEDSPCVAFIYTKNDVFYYRDANGIPDLNEEVYLSDDNTHTVLQKVGGSSYIYEEIGEFIDQEVRTIRKTRQ